MVCMCAGACTHVCILVWRPEVDIRVSFSVMLRQGISLNLGLSVSASLASQHAPGIFISASPHVPLGPLGFSMVFCHLLSSV